MYVGAFAKVPKSGESSYSQMLENTGHLDSSAMLQSCRQDAGHEGFVHYNHTCNKSLLENSWLIIIQELHVHAAETALYCKFVTTSRNLTLYSRRHGVTKISF